MADLMRWLDGEITPCVGVTDSPSAIAEHLARKIGEIVERGGKLYRVVEARDGIVAYEPVRLNA